MTEKQAQDRLQDMLTVVRIELAEIEEFHRSGQRVHLPTYHSLNRATNCLHNLKDRLTKLIADLEPKPPSEAPFYDLFRSLPEYMDANLGIGFDCTKLDNILQEHRRNSRNKEKLDTLKKDILACFHDYDSRNYGSVVSSIKAILNGEDML